MAVNLALGVQYGTGVIPAHRNLVTLKPKPTTMASYAANNPNPASKYGALQVLTTTDRRGQRIVVGVAAPDSTTQTTIEDGVSAILPGIPTTTIKFENNVGVSFYHKDLMFWMGNDTINEERIPSVISYGPPKEYTHKGDRNGSVGGLLYQVAGSVCWVVAWRNPAKGRDNQKVFTKIIEMKDPTFDRKKFWEGIFADLPDQEHDDVDYYGAYKAHLHITSEKPLKVTASFDYK